MRPPTSMTKGRRPRLLFVSQWFDPEPTFKGLLFARALSDSGYDVEVVTGFPNYPGGKVYPGYRIRPIARDKLGGISITRLFLYPSHNSSSLGRALNYLSFFFSAVFYLLVGAKRADVIYVYHPPLTVGLAAVVAKLLRRTPVVLDIQDMWPDTLAATGMAGNARLLSIVGTLCRWLYRRVTHIVVLSPGFRRLLVSRGVADEKITVIPNWADEAAVANATVDRPTEMSTQERFRVLFAGNMGYAQALDAVLSAAALLTETRSPVQIFLLGGGLDVDRLRARADSEGLDNITFLPQVPMAEVGRYLNAADATLVHLRDDPLFAVTIPSKTQAYLAASRPIIMAVRGDAADMILEAGAGVVAIPENAQSIADAIRQLSAMSQEQRAAIGAAGRAYYDARLSMVRGVTAFDAIFRRLTV